MKALINKNTSQVIQVNEAEAYELAISVLEVKFKNSNFITSSQATKQYLVTQLAHEEREVFCCIYLNNQHQVISFEKVFFGTVNSCAVYPREIAKQALLCNATAAIFAHNHPSGTLEPSNADKAITARLKTALALLDISVLDHIIVGGVNTMSFAEQGLI